MQKLRIILLIILFTITMGYAISKEEFLKLPYKKRRDFPTVVGISSEYAMPRDEFMKLSFEVRKAMGLEKGREMIQYAIKNLGKKKSELDISQLYDLGRSNPIIPKDSIVNYGTVGRMYHGACENHFKAAEYLYKDYLEWKKSELGQPSLWQHGGGDQDPLTWLISVYSEYQMYEDWARLDADYYKFHWLRLAESQPKDIRQKFLESIEAYRDFMQEWKEIKKLAKTTKPKPLSPQVQNHEWFYSDKQEEVLKALEYYYQNKVQFMLEKALKHKDPVVAAKAKEYIESLAKGADDETKH